MKSDMMQSREIEALIDYCVNFSLPSDADASLLRETMEKLDLMIYQLASEKKLTDQQVRHLDDLLNQLLFTLRGDYPDMRHYVKTIRMIGSFLKRKIKH